ncbi:hypothetical protein GCM10008956_24180 [Deinococcus arenae]|uniref:Uncharacterized protein n=1 Tax=Deinococcus arenae TaxID=1452751 RepID=A0A8H9GQD9_9DEIO|nr:hypothetical protein [Deinococcus arenae]AWT34897.1 hypothetical protein DM785_04470 [Deinococcus actinosclerus]GGM47162.1 hypothetical protein GCM10008956_24180 [Deinococcus arenae]
MTAHTPLTREEIAGVEFDWFATDPNGHLAQFLAAGDDTVPAHALASEELLEATHVWLDTRPETEATNTPAGGFDEHLCAPQRRGAFVYDHVPGEAGVYRLVAAPRTPLTLDALPAPLQAYLGTLRLPVALGAARLFVGLDGDAQALTD